MRSEQEIFNEIQKKNPLADREMRFPIWYRHYREIFDKFAELDVLFNPHQVFVGGCGFGADILAFHESFPSAHITAVSLDQTPLPIVTNTLGNLLTFFETSIKDHLRKVVSQGEQYDLLLFANSVVVYADPEFYSLLATATQNHGQVLHIHHTTAPFADKFINTYGLYRVPFYGLVDERDMELWRK